MAENTKYDFDRVVRGCITIGVLALLFMLARRLSGVLVPFLVSWLVAYMMNPLCERWQRLIARVLKGKHTYRGMAVVMTILTVIVVITAFILLIVPPMMNEVQVLREYATHYVTNFNYLDFIPDDWEDEFHEWVASINVSDVMQNEDVRAGLKSIGQKFWSALSGGLSVLSGLTIVFISFLYVVFILLDYEALSTRWAELIPMKYRAGAQMLMSDLSEGMESYFRGQAKVASIVGVLFAIGFSIIGLPMGIAMGLFVGLLNMIPYLQTIAVFPCLLLGVIQAAETGRPFWVIFVSLLVVFLVVQGIQDLVLTPKIMGKVTGLHPAIILLSLSIWGSLLGVMGMLIALPLTTLIISYYKLYVAIDESSKMQAK